VLRKPDPRFIALQQFSSSRAELKDSPVIKLVNKISEVAPGVLMEHGKAKSVYPNVDAVSGCLLHHYGLTEFKYYTVIFGVSRGKRVAGWFPSAFSLNVVSSAWMRVAVSVGPR
jgi:citrate synthase